MKRNSISTRLSAAIVVAPLIAGLALRFAPALMPPLPEDRMGGPIASAIKNAGAQVQLAAKQKRRPKPNPAFAERMPQASTLADSAAQTSAAAETFAPADSAKVKIDSLKIPQ